MGTVKSAEPRHYAIFIEIAQTAVEISQFLDFSKWRPPLSWNLNFFLTVGHAKKVELCHLAKFGRNRLNCGRDMVIFRFFKMAAAAILDFKNFKFLTVGTVKRVELRHRAKFRRNRSKRGRDM